MQFSSEQLATMTLDEMSRLSTQDVLEIATIVDLYETLNPALVRFCQDADYRAEIRRRARPLPPMPSEKRVPLTSRDYLSRLARSIGHITREQVKEPLERRIRVLEEKNKALESRIEELELEVVSLNAKAVQHELWP